MGQNDSCSICGELKKLDEHHLNYEKNITVKVCRKCHKKIHVTNGFHDELKPVDSCRSKVVEISEEANKIISTIQAHFSKKTGFIPRKSEIVKKALELFTMNIEVDSAIFRGRKRK